MPRKNPNGFGSVYHRKDGHWVTALTVTVKCIVGHAPTRKAAQQKL